MYTKFAAAALLTFTGLTHADGSTDWKMYAVTAKKPADVMFYLNSDIIRTGGHVQVWMKALEAKKLDSNIKSVVEKTASLMKEAYQPPLRSDMVLNDDQVMLITAYEQIADVGSLTPRMKILYEIDCAQKVYRVLSIVLQQGQSDSTIRPWEHVPPESPLATLSKLTCRPS